MPCKVGVKVMKKESATSQYQGVYYSADMQKWVVEMEKHDRHPGFYDEREAGIYAEYFYRHIYGKTVNFPELDNTALFSEYERIMSKREIEQAISRSAARQGPKKHTKKTSKYFGVFLKDGSRWVARIQYRNKSIYICSFSTNQINAEKMAALAYDEKAMELYGENAKLNFPENRERKASVKQ